MKNLIFLFSILSTFLIMYCNNKGNDNKYRIKNNFIDEVIIDSLLEENISLEQYNKAKHDYDSLIILDKNRFEITENSLIIKKNKLKTYINKGVNTDSDMMEIYQYYGYCKPLKMDIIRVKYYEDSEVILLDENSKEYKVQGIPYISNDKKYFATFFINPYDIPETIIDIYLINKKKLEKIRQFNTTNWFIWELVWKNDFLYVKYTETLWGNQGFYNTNFKYKKLIFNKK